MYIGLHTYMYITNTVKVHVHVHVHVHVYVYIHVHVYKLFHYLTVLIGPSTLYCKLNTSQPVSPGDA